MTGLRTLVVDDEPLARERLVTLVQDGPDLDLVGVARNGLEALDLIARLNPDLLLVDVEMPALSGFAVVTALADHPMPAIVFITAYDQYALQAFEVGAIDYLVKPVTKLRFATTVKRAQTRLGAGSSHQQQVMTAATIAERARGPRRRYVVRQGYTHYLVSVADIRWIEAADNYLRLHTRDRTHLIRGTIRDAEAELDPALFIRIHRSAMVAIEAIRAIGRTDSGGAFIELAEGQRLGVSRQFRERIRALGQVRAS